MTLFGSLSQFLKCRNNTYLDKMLNVLYKAKGTIYIIDLGNEEFTFIQAKQFHKFSSSYARHNPL